MPDTQRKINVAAAVPLQGGKMPMATPVPASTRDGVDEEVTVDRESYNELRAENIKLANRNRKLQNTIDGLSTTAGSASGQHATEITALKHDRALADKRAKELEEKCTGLCENNARLKADVDKLASQTAELSIKGHQDHIAAQDEKQKLEAENKKNASETKALREKLEATVVQRNAEQEEQKKLIAKLKAENKFLGEKFKKHSSTATGKVEESRAKLESAQTRIQQLEKQVAESDARLGIENDIPPGKTDQMPDAAVSAREQVEPSAAASDDPIFRLRVENQILHGKIAELLKEKSG